jgi:hypothetical protein
MRTRRARRLLNRLGALLLAISAGATMAPLTASAFSYAHIAGSTFRPRDSATTWNYDGGGCVTLAAGTGAFVHKLLLPQDAAINYLRVYYNDASASDITAYITSYDNAGGTADLTSAASSGTPGYSEALSPLIAYSVDNASNALVVNVAFGAADPNLAFCGVRVAYTEDRIFANAFE